MGIVRRLWWLLEWCSNASRAVSSRAGAAARSASSTAAPNGARPSTVLSQTGAVRSHYCAIVAHTNLDSYVENLRQQLLLAADGGGEDARALAERLLPPLDSAMRLVLLEAISAAADEITTDLAPGSVEVRLRGLNPSFVVTAPPFEQTFDRSLRTPAPGRIDAEDGGTTRINLRLPDALKSRAEEAAGREGLSLNAWLVRAATAALESEDRRPRPRGSQHFTGWVR